MDRDLLFEKKYGFEVWPKARINKALSFAEGYRQFLSQCKTESEVVSFVASQAKQEGFVQIEGYGTGFVCPVFKKAPQKVLGINRGKSLALGIFGQKPLKSGLRMILAHIDSPRLDLKPQPLYESEKIAWLKTQYYGGIKKYQWPTLPLAIHGEIVLANGKEILINMGENEAEPVLTITDLLPHLSKEQMQKKLEEAIEAEELNIVVGSLPSSKLKLAYRQAGRQRAKSEKNKDTIKLGILELLNKRYGITEEDLVSSDLEIVPAGKARDLGFDASMILAYGQDDRVCAYSALQALLIQNDPEYTSLIVLVDREEIGSEGNTGALSNFIPDFISEMLYLETGTHDENLLRDTLAKTKAISADVTVGFDPDYASAFDPKNTARVGAGIVLEKYTGHRGKSGTSEASAQYMAFMRNIFNKNGILWQTGGLGKTDLGGGGTVAQFLAQYNLEVVDAGPAVLSMHAPFEITSKADVYSCFEAYRVFLG